MISNEFLPTSLPPQCHPAPCGLPERAQQQARVPPPAAPPQAAPLPLLFGITTRGHKLVMVLSSIRHDIVIYHVIVICHRPPLGLVTETSQRL